MFQENAVIMVFICISYNIVHFITMISSQLRHCSCYILVKEVVDCFF